MKRVVSRPHVASVYVHWPFCTKLCNYCNFNKYVASQDEDLNKRLGQCLEQEARFLMKKGQIEAVESIYFGGGTPSLMPPQLVENVIKIIKKSCLLPLQQEDSKIEVTLEVNPSPDLSLERLKDFIDAGVNRLSIGVQAFDDECLRWMNRDHNVASATQILDQVSSLGQQKLSSFSIDLMFARPNQGLTAWMNELEFVQSRFPNLPHISLYELTVEKSTPLQADVKSNKIQLPSEEEKADLYQATVEILAKASYECYEVSNFATKNQHRGQHNSRYWQGGTFIGLGPGAHGRYMIEGHRHATVQTPSPINWMQEVLKNGHATRKTQKMSRYEVLSEILATSLRTIWGLETDAWHYMTGNEVPLSQLLESHPLLASFQESGQLICDEKGIRLSRQGLALADYITPYLLSNLRQQLQELM